MLAIFLDVVLHFGPFVVSFPLLLTSVDLLTIVLRAEVARKTGNGREKWGKPSCPLKCLFLAVGRVEKSDLIARPMNMRDMVARTTGIIPDQVSTVVPCCGLLVPGLWPPSDLWCSVLCAVALTSVQLQQAGGPTKSTGCSCRACSCTKSSGRPSQVRPLAPCPCPYPPLCSNDMADLVKTRTVVQIRTHAQKYFQKLDKGHGSSSSSSAGTAGSHGGHTGKHLLLSPCVCVLLH